MAAYERVTLNRGGRNSRFDCICTLIMAFLVCLYDQIPFVIKIESGVHQKVQVGTFAHHTV